MAATLQRDGTQRIHAPASVFEVLAAEQLHRLLRAVVSYLLRRLKGIAAIPSRQRVGSRLLMAAIDLLSLAWQRQTVAAAWYGLRLIPRSSTSASALASARSTSWLWRYALVRTASALLPALADDDDNDNDNDNDHGNVPSLQDTTGTRAPTRAMAPTVVLLLPEPMPGRRLPWSWLWPRDLSAAAKATIALVEMLDVGLLVAYAVGLQPAPGLAHVLAGTRCVIPTAEALQHSRLAAQLGRWEQHASRASLPWLRQRFYDLGTAVTAASRLAAPAAMLLLLLATEEEVVAAPPSAAVESLPPPPPYRFDAAPAGRAFDSSEDVMQCPLCRAAVQIPAVLPCAGVVACLTCLTDTVRANGGRCPWTRASVQPKDIIRLYLEA